MSRILLVEDEDLVRYSLRNVLEKLGHEVFEASDGDEGLSEFKSMMSKDKSPDVVITDIIMPNKHGYDLICNIRSISTDTKIIAISGGGGANPKVFLEISEFLGVNHILAKPFSFDDLLQAVNHCTA